MSLTIELNLTSSVKVGSLLPSGGPLMLQSSAVHCPFHFGSMLVIQTFRFGAARRVLPFLPIGR